MNWYVQHSVRVYSSNDLWYGVTCREYYMNNTLFDFEIKWTKPMKR